MAPLGSPRRLLGWLFAVAVGIGSARADAHPIVDEGIARLREAEFRGALDAFDRAESASDLALSELIVLLEHRALAEFALGQRAEVDATVARLAALDPQHVLSAEAPPELGEAFARAVLARAGPLTLALDAVREPEAVRLETRSSGDPGGLVRWHRISARVERGPWTDAAGSSLRLRATRTQLVEAHAEAVGPGGAIVARAGSRDEPLRFAPSRADRPARADRGGTGAWVWIAGGAAVIATAVLVIAVASSSGGESDLTRPRTPVVE